MNRLIWLFILMLCFWNVCAQNVFKQIWQSFGDYDKRFRLTLEPTNVTFSIVLTKILDVNEAAGMMRLSFWQVLRWHDMQLQWVPKQYKNITSIYVPLKELWVPDIVIREMVSQLVLPDKNERYARIENDGAVLSVLAITADITCDYNVQEFPFDTQKCNVTFMSWMQDTEHMTLVQSDTEDSLDEYHPNVEWQLINVSIVTKHSTYEKDYTDIVYSLTLKRHSSYYIITLYMPTYLIAAIGIIGLFTPSTNSLERTERCSIGATALLTVAVLLLMVNDIVPKSAQHFPLVGRYIVASMMLTIIATLLAVVLMHIDTMGGRHKKMPAWLKSLARLNTKVNISDSKEIEKGLNDWSLLCFRLDIVCLVLFSGSNSILFMVYARFFS